MELRLDEPFWLLLLVPAALYLFLTGWKHYRNANALFRTSFILRLLSVCLLVTALASPVIHQPIEDEQILFLWDRSSSMSQAENGIEEQLNRALDGKGIDQSAGIFTFAEDFQSLMPLSSDPSGLPAEMTANRAEHTNIAQALELAANTGDIDRATRLVLLSDGNETRSSALESIDRINGERVTVDVLPIEPPAGNEAALT